MYKDLYKQDGDKIYRDGDHVATINPDALLQNQVGMWKDLEQITEYNGWTTQKDHFKLEYGGGDE